MMRKWDGNDVKEINKRQAIIIFTLILLVFLLCVSDFMTDAMGILLWGVIIWFLIEDKSKGVS